MTVLKKTDITEARRRGKKREGFQRPILMKVRTKNMKMEILGKKNKLRGTGGVREGSTKAKKGFGEIYEDRKGMGTRSDANV